GLPAVVVGLVVWVLLSRSGPLGAFGLLFTPSAMVIAQTVLITPLVVALTRQLMEDLHAEYGEQLRAHGAGTLRAVPTLLVEGRFALATVLLAAFGRALSAVGAVIIVGGNIAHVTRVMPTAIALETSRGEVALALGLGILLLGISLAVAALAEVAREVARRAGA
ncbi:MAG: ABC transporter permease, partial [Myxococcota bacterium]